MNGIECYINDFSTLLYIGINTKWMPYHMDYDYNFPEKLIRHINESNLINLMD